VNKARDDWEGHWEEFANAAAWNPAQIMRHNLILGIMASLVRGTLNILDIGCGQGDFLAKAEILFPKAKLVGVELSEQGAAITRNKVPQAEIIVGNLFDAPKELNKYCQWAHIGICSEVLEHLDEPVSFLNSASRYIATNGKIILTVPGGPISAFDRQIGHRQHYNRTRLADLMKKSGFDCERVYSAGFPFFNLYRAAIILRGKKVACDAAYSSKESKSPARIIAKIFEKLFSLDFHHTAFGWQMVAVGRKK